MSLQEPLELDEEVYLVPRTLWAPSIAYKQPRGRIIKTGNVRVTVALDDGDPIDIHVDNVTRTPPGQRRPHKKPAPPPPACDGTAACPLHTQARTAHRKHEQGVLW